MALWVNDKTGERFDDGLNFKPGEDGFTKDLAVARFSPDRCSYIGTPNWQPPAEPQSTDAGTST